MTVESLLDLFLGGALVVSAGASIRTRELFTGVVLYIVFGLLLALVWVRLEAPDLAIAEAAIGAGITGAMLLGAARQMGGSAVEPRPSAFTVVTGTLAILGIAAVLAASFLRLAAPSGELAIRVSSSLAASGVEHPVTAVLLNFRGYDTWLETGVLLVAAIGVLALRRATAGAPGKELASEAGGARTNPHEAGVGANAGATGGADLPKEEIPLPVAAGAASLLAPLGVVVAGYIVWRGSHAPGGAFQAGAVLAAIAVLLILLGRSPLAQLSPAWRDAALALGFAVFFAAGTAGLAGGGAFLTYSADTAGLTILVIESAIAISVGVTLALLYEAGRVNSRNRSGSRIE